MQATRAALLPMRRHRRAGRLSLTPLIDCVFILLIFFMLETNFMRPRAISFAQSTSSPGAVADAVLIAVEVHDDDTIWLNGSPSSMDGLRSYASQVGDPVEAKVVLALDETVILQRAVDVMDIFNQFGMTNISMSAARRFEQPQ
jgi:biopolymer transport protein ExbD